MCFTPQVSIATALIEFGVAIYLWHKIKDNKSLTPIPIFIAILGLYQFTEFMLCTTTNPVFWARIGFAAYTFLPAVGMHLVFNMKKKKLGRLIYLFPTVFGVFAIFYPNFILYSSCNLIHATVKSIIFNENKVLMFIYLVYYFSAFAVCGSYLLLKDYKTSKKTKKITIGLSLIPLALLFSQIYLIFYAIRNINPSNIWIAVSSLVVLISLIIIAAGFTYFVKNKNLAHKVLLWVTVGTIAVAFFLYGVLPQIGLELSSIFCHFALLYTITAVIFVNTQ
jgi:hypothetical protein